MDEESSPVGATAPDATTPPGFARAKRSHIKGNESNDRDREGFEAVDADALSKALKEFEDADQTREKLPAGSPSRKRQRIYGDRLAETFSNLPRQILEPVVV